MSNIISIMYDEGPFIAHSSFLAHKTHVYPINPWLSSCFSGIELLRTYLGPSKNLKIRFWIWLRQNEVGVGFFLFLFLIFQSELKVSSDRLRFGSESNFMLQHLLQSNLNPTLCSDSNSDLCRLSPTSTRLVGAK